MRRIQVMLSVLVVLWFVRVFQFAFVFVDKARPGVTDPRSEVFSVEE